METQDRLGKDRLGEERIEIDDGGKPPRSSNSEIYKHIIGFLNEQAGTAYRHTGKATQEKINARLREGFKVEDFETVITKKCAEWKGTEMEQYLRPETLFGPKFENYLNAKINKGRSNNNGYAENRERIERESADRWGSIGTTL